ncbi:unnamed protein product [Colias eurytheme]|nr:unnamed protein product [Colias eurytheme]
MAGKDWLQGFLSRNDRLSIRKPETTSLSRATSFNRTNVAEYFDKLAQVMDPPISSTSPSLLIPSDPAAADLSTASS